jgi:hypothetical protein
MEKQALSSFMRSVTLIAVVLCGFVGLVCLLSGWSTLTEYGQALMWAGILLFFVSALASVRTRSTASDQVSHDNARAEGSSAPSKRDMDSEATDPPRFLALVVAAILVTVVGYVLQHYA